jgi:type III restriction enzyme
MNAGTSSMAAAESLDNPILNGPYDPPGRHFELGPDGPTGTVVDGRRLSESFIPVPPSRKKAEQQALDFDVTGERRALNTLINDIRQAVDLWRARNYNGVTPITRKLLQHWAAKPPEREDPAFFCQREAAETAIYLAEAAGRHGNPDFRARIDPENQLHNLGLPRVALKMATGSGKTVVMGMLIAWQTINKVANPNDARFAKRFLILTPGITIRDRLRVLEPADDHNYYRERDLVPPDLWDALLQSQIVITNYHAFLPRDAKEIQGVAANTRKILTAGKSVDPFKETNDQMVARVLRDLAGRGGRAKTKGGEIVVLNDEAHHCYQDKPLADPSEVDSEDKKEAEQRNADARVWFKGLQAIQKKVGIKAIYDLSATPYYLKGSGYNEGYIFPWTVSDFSLMDAIESGIVKVPRIPVDDDAAGDILTYKQLWDYVGKWLPKRKTKKLEEGEWTIPKELEGALQSLYRSYERRFEHWKTELEPLGEPPPVMIVVCPNTLVSKLVYDWIAGKTVELDDGTPIPKPGDLPLLSNVTDGVWASRPRTILIDSAQLERGEVMGRDFKSAATHEIETFKDEYRRRNPGADIEKLTDEDLLREVMNTVGKKGRLGENVRCVVSVSMLTEGWDANTVTHILGIRRFGSQLLCEQVVGRGLRRRSYAVNDDGHFDPEYAEVYGVPFAFIPGKPTKESPPKRPAIEVRALEERAELRIAFPKVDGYRLEIPDESFYPAFDDDSRLHLERSTVATWTVTRGIAGEPEEQTLDLCRNARAQEVAYEIARLLVRDVYTAGSDSRPWLFPQLVEITRDWLRTCVTVEPGTPIGMLLLSEGTHLAKEKLERSIWKVEGNRQARFLPVLRPFDSEGSTDDVHFFTRKHEIEATKSHVNRVVLDGPRGNTWEQILSLLCEQHDDVAAYVKNDHLGFAIPYVHEGRTYQYVPDFLVRLRERGDDMERTLIVEVSGGQKSAHSPGSVKAKAETARYQWCAAVNNHGGYGRWGYDEITDMNTAAERLDTAIQNLYADGVVTGLRDVQGVGV